LHNPLGLRSLSRRAAQLGVVALLATASLVVGAGPAAAAQPPVVTGVAPFSGPTAGGTLVTITGTNLQSGGTPTVTFDGIDATVGTSNATTVTVTSPAHAVGTVDIVVTTNGGSSDTVGPANDFTYVVGPTVTAIDPTFGPESGGTTVTITGTGFTGASDVRFGGTPASYVINDATQITATSPAGSGTVDVVVTTPGGSATATGAFTYEAPTPAPTVTGVSPSTGPEAGGTDVTITGTNLTGATDVSFGGTPASYVVNDATQITATSPPGAGTVDVTVTTAGGTSSAAGTDNDFTYVAAPNVTDVTPATGPEAGGTTVVITGTDLTGASDVTFGGTTALFTVDSATQITATSPAGTGTVDVVVTTPGGSATATGAFTYEAPMVAPSVTGVSPATGPEAGGTSVTITGTDLGGATAVTFGGTPATSVTSNTPTQIVAVSPAGTGTVDVVVTTAGGTSATAGTDNDFTYVAAPPAPVVSAVSPTSGTTAGGTTVTITGTGLAGATAVTFGGTAATSFTVDNSTQITATSPAHAAGAVDVTVETPGGSDTATGAFTYVAPGGGGGGGGGTTPTKQPQHITFTQPSGGQVGDTETLQAMGGGSGNPVVFTVDPTSTPGACTVSGNTVTYTGAGSCVIDANQAGNANYDAAPQVQRTAPVTEKQQPEVTNPSLTASVTSSHKKHHGWYRDAVTITFSCAAGSAALVAPCPDPVTLRHNGKGQKVTRTINGADGGTTTVTVGPINIDHRKPHLKVKGAHKGKVYAHGRHLTCVANDSLSGVQKCVIHKHHHKRGDVRRIKWTAKAKDKAGNVRRHHGFYFVKRR
jgi:hypothetical protein